MWRHSIVKLLSISNKQKVLKVVKWNEGKNYDRFLVASKKIVEQYLKSLEIKK